MTGSTGKPYEREIMRYLTEKNQYTAFDLDIMLDDTTRAYKRQIDVWLPKTREVVECKHYSKPIGVDLIDALVGVIDDVGASGGRFFSHMGFTKTARMRAEKALIKCETRRFPKSVETYYPRSGYGYYTGDYADPCVGIHADDPNLALISYGDGQGNESPICVGYSADWKNPKMHKFIAHVILSHYTSEIPDDPTVGFFVELYGDRLQLGYGWEITEREVARVAPHVRGR